MGRDWLEIAGCGMVHPQVFETSAAIRKSGPAGRSVSGIERIAMLRYGINDIRPFTKNDVRILKQFLKCKHRFTTLEFPASTKHRRHYRENAAKASKVRRPARSWCRCSRYWRGNKMDGILSLCCELDRSSSGPAKATSLPTPHRNCRALRPTKEDPCSSLATTSFIWRWNQTCWPITQQ